MTEAHHLLVERKRLERGECPKCAELLATVEIDGPRERLACPQRYCGFELWRAR